MPASHTALITGASAGLGAEFARQLAAQGYHLILSARRQDRLEELCKTLQGEHSTQCELIVADLATPEGIQQVAASITAHPELHLLVNNAGFGLRNRFALADPQEIETMIQVHINATVLLSRAALPGMLARKQGYIINVASMAGFLPLRSVLYGTSKTFLISFSQALDFELTGTGVQVQALCPGFTHTEFHDVLGTGNYVRHSIPRILWLTSEQVVRHSLKDLPRHKVVSIPGRQYQIIGFFMRSRLTYGIVQAIAVRMFSKRRPF
jgi:hypothetical protein